MPKPRHLMPSGRTIRAVILKTVFRGREWRLEERAGLFFLWRMKRGDSSTIEYFRGDATMPLSFSEEDADDVAAVMNGTRRLRLDGIPVPVASEAL